MPRIDPVQLLNCLSVLLSPNGGIKSRNEVQRLAGLMTKFSKKLVSKCIYIQILKCTETELLGLFMGSGGWLLVHMWLTESIVAKNWPLVKELLELLLLCPVDIERLKTNNCPKLVKELSKDGNHFAIRALASKLVEQWLKTVKGEPVIPILESEITQLIATAQAEVCKSEIGTKLEDTNTEKVSADIKTDLRNDGDSKSYNIESVPNSVVKNEDVIVKENKELEEDKETLPVLKISLKDGKQIISNMDDEETKEESITEKSNDKHKRSKEKSSENSNSKSSSSKHSSKSRSSSSSDKHKSSHRSSSSSSSSSRSKDSKHKDKHSSSKSKSESRKSSDRSSSSSSKDKDERSNKSDKSKSRDKEKEKIQDKDQDKNKLDKNDKTANLQKTSNDKLEDSPTPSIHKLGKIPKLSEVKKEKPSISIEVRKPDDPKPKTVKTFHSKFRKHGLEEEVKPPPSRASFINKKVAPAPSPTVPIPKRPSPVHTESPPEKKLKAVEPLEKPGSIKLIPAKPKPMLLLESDMFMDALNASATNKKEPKKRKRRTSGSKDGNAPSDGSPPHTPSSIVTSPNSESKSVPPRFYQDTLDTEENKEKPVQGPEIKDNTDAEVPKNEPEESMDTTEPHTLTINGLKGVLCYHKRKGPKKSIKWKPDSELEEIQYFELDETERVNVTKTFTDMKYLERINEREAFQKARNLSNDDIMEEKTIWRPLIPVDVDGQIQVEHGKNSKEKDIQALRQKGTLQPLYFHKSMIPDSPFEPDPETHTYSEPTIIPLEDITGNQDNISDFRNMPWPEPKGTAPPSSSNINMPTMFPPPIAQFPNGFPNPQFSGVGGFQGPNMVPPDWQNGVPPHLINNGIPGPMNPAPLTPGAIPPGNVPPGMMMPSETMMMTPDMFGGPNGMFPVPPEGFNMQQNMFPMEYNLPGPQGPGPEGFPVPGNFRGAMRGGRGGGHWRGKSNNNWEGEPQRGRGGHSRGSRKAVCIYFKRRGSCRHGDNCSFLHIAPNNPY
ncbi:unnamed protein product [Diatraea saccharalis]|uniref:Serine/threonine-protein phosphatase 1 regulatory subunit 10 n=2 Tax=Diatraea saccharalis TaxID=40085 RepID=A0A9N9W956_9NEOP|nr:unnamed protein product [Diatraea saccharalis]